MRELKRAFGALRRKGQRLFGILGNEAGEIAVPDRPGYQYARVERGSERVTLMCLGNVRPRLNTAVIVEQNPLTEEFQIVGLDVETTRAAGDDPTTALFYTEPHAASHEWRRDADDCLLWLHPNQIYFLRVQPGDVSGHVVVQGGPYFVHGQLCWKRSQSDVDLTTYFPAWGAAWVMLCLDADDAITVVQAAGGVDARDIADLDVIPTGNIALAAVKLTAGAAIDFFDDIVPLWQITQFDASVLANGEVRITEDGLVVGVDYPAPTGEWHFLGGMASECGESLRGLLSVWDTDKVFLGLLDEGEDRKDALLLWGDNVADVLRFAFCHYATGFSEVGRLTYDGILTFIDTVAAGDWQAGDITLGKWAKQGLMPTFATTLDAVGHGAAWAGTVYALGVVDYTTYKDVVLAIRQETTYDKFRVAYIAELGGLEADVFSIARDGTIGVLDGATVDGVDISAHASAVNPHGTGFTDLLDAPEDYTGMGGRVVSVKADETGLEFTGYYPLQLFAPVSTWYLGDGIRDDFFQDNLTPSGSAQWDWADAGTGPTTCDPQESTFTQRRSWWRILAGGSTGAYPHHAIAVEPVSGATSSTIYQVRLDMFGIAVDGRCGFVLMDTAKTTGCAWWWVWTVASQKFNLIYATYSSANAWLSQENAEDSNVAYTTHWTVRWTSSDITLGMVGPQMVGLRPLSGSGTAYVYDPLRMRAQAYAGAGGHTPAYVYLFAEGNLLASLNEVYFDFVNY